MESKEIAIECSDGRVHQRVTGQNNERYKELLI